MLLKTHRRKQKTFVTRKKRLERLTPLLQSKSVFTSALHTSRTLFLTHETARASKTGFSVAENADPREPAAGGPGLSNLNLIRIASRRASRREKRIDPSAAADVSVNPSQNAVPKNFLRRKATPKNAPTLGRVAAIPRATPKTRIIRSRCWAILPWRILQNRKPRNTRNRMASVWRRFRLRRQSQSSGS